MTLVAIDTKEKSDEITDLLKKILGESHPLWIGAVARGQNAYQYSWITSGNKVEFTNFSPGQPDFLENGEFCLQVAWNNAMQWNDHACQYLFGFICEPKQQQYHEEELEKQLKQQESKLQQMEKELKKEQLFNKILLEYLKIDSPN